MESEAAATSSGVTAETIANVFGPETAADAAEAGLVEALPEGEASEAAPKAAKEPDVPTTEQEHKERVARRIAAATKAEMRLKQQRSEMAKTRAELDAYKAKIERIKTSPLDAIREIGLEPTEFLQRVVNDGHESPEQRIARLEERLEQQEKARTEERAKFIQQQEEAFKTNHLKQVQQDFVNLVEREAEKYPTLIEMYDAEEIASRGLQVATKWGKAYFRETGTYPTDEVIAEYLEQQAAEQKSARAERIQRLLGKSASSESKTSRAAPPVSKTPLGPRTLTNRDSSHKVAPPGRHMTQKEADEESLRLLRQAGFK